MLADDLVRALRLTLPDMDSNLDGAALLVGEWGGVGKGFYPTISTFEYTERLTIAATGRPFLSYLQRTWDRVSGTPLHTECGYIRLLGDDHMEMVIVQPTGVVEAHDGVVIREHDGELKVRFSSRAVGLSASAKPVEEVIREFVVRAGELSVSLAMAAVGQPLQGHLSSQLVKDSE